MSIPVRLGTVSALFKVSQLLDAFNTSEQQTGGSGISKNIMGSIYKSLIAVTDIKLSINHHKIPMMKGLKRASIRSMLL